MSRPVLVTQPPLEGIEALDRLLARITADGVIDRDEQRQLVRAVKAMRRRMTQLHETMAFVDMAIHGDGIYADWFGRRVKEEMKSRAHLRIVPSEEDGPPPDGPAAMKQAA